jgi:hypothetical protein
MVSIRGLRVVRGVRLLVSEGGQAGEAFGEAVIASVRQIAERSNPVASGLGEAPLRWIASPPTEARNDEALQAGDSTGLASL